MSVRLTEPVRRWSNRRRRPAESPPRQHNRHIHQRTIQLRLVHITNSILRKLRICVENICNSPIGHEVLVHRHLQFLDFAIVAEDLAEMRFLDVLCEFFDDDFCAAGDSSGGCG